ncbi:hypothetical protein ACIPJS_30790 [Streptomyces sp. NPDC086783]|uniref:hypothetical protein n=1 Tax=Streptomyces sp. NPDC086783 TaxID=3365758 RepID=UPI00381985C4
MRRRLRGVRPWLTLVVSAALLTGCGIRSTQVPTDFGPAPSRVPCSLSGSDIATRSAPGIPVQVFLLCSSQLVTVDRSVRIPDGTAEAQRRVLVAQGLLDQLAGTPSSPERQAGYSTDVRAGTRVSGPQGKDPENTFRLSTAPEKLTSYALAQIICTFADSEATAADDGSVILGGPAPAPLHHYDCTTEVRASPGTETPPSTDITEN